MKLKIWEMSLITALAAVMIFCCVTQQSAAALSDKLVRLHVVANSDSEDDQELKLRVRNAVLQAIEGSLEYADSREEAVEIISENLSLIAEKAGETVRENGKDYAVTASITRESFPTRRYDTFSLPAGEYTSLRVSIGEGEGHNWWCVAFPPLCKTAAMVDRSSFLGLTDNEIALITGETGEYKISFKALEIVQYLRGLFRK